MTCEQRYTTLVLFFFYFKSLGFFKYKSYNSYCATHLDITSIVVVLLVTVGESRVRHETRVI